MSVWGQFDGQRCVKLGSGVVGIYVTYLLAGIFHEWMIKESYSNRFTLVQENFTWPVGFLIFPIGITWLAGALYNRLTIPPGEHTPIPPGKSALCAATVGLSTITYTYAIYWTNFPVVMMVKSCNILSVVLVGVFCSQVKDKNLQLGRKKIVIGLVVTLGIVVFKYFDPEGAKKEERKTQLLGIVLLLVSLLADGFLPDFQAAIKSVHHPRPMEMMVEINKWVFIMALGASIVTWQLPSILSFTWQHGLFALHMLLMGVLSTVGQMFVYQMIKEFKQHFVPFVITTRKIVTVGLSILYFGHETNAGQVIGILIVFAIVTYEFVSELKVEKVESNIPSVESERLNMKEELEEEEGLAIATDSSADPAQK